MAGDLFTADLDVLDNGARFAAIEEFAKTQPSEGWRYDYTMQWDESALKTVAAFANTFGGILIVGVKKGSKDATCELIGVASISEYKTRIASAIAANISPVPTFSIFECHKPDATDRKFCVVRVRDTKVLHLVTKKGLDPVHVRNEDQTLPANADQLRRLIERERDLPTLLQRVSQRAVGLRDSMMVKCGYTDSESETWHQSACRQSPTSLKLQMISTDATVLELDKLYEDHLRKFIAELYPRFYPTAGEQYLAPPANFRHADLYEYVAYHKNLDYESRWRITGLGDIGHATQMKYQMPGGETVWSIVDLSRYIILFLRLTVKWWDYLRYFGDGHLCAQLNVGDLPVWRHPKHGYFVEAFNPAYTLAPVAVRPDIRRDAVSLSTVPGNAASTETKVTYFSCNENVPGIATSILNRLLRSLGHVADTKLLQSSIESLI